MGEDIDNCPYESGAPCNVCSSEIFDGDTPKYVLASFSGVVSCPGEGDSSLNGSWLLTQSEETPCIWLESFDDFVITWDLSNGSALVARVGFGQFDIFFVNIVAETDCLDEFVNENEICGLINAAHSGVGTITWGCSIRP